MKKFAAFTALALCAFAAFAQPKTLMVSLFENRGARLDEAALDTARESMVTAFINTGSFHVLAGTETRERIRLERLSQTGGAEDRERLALQMGREAGADCLALVSVRYNGWGNLFQARLLEVRTGKELARAEVTVSAQADAGGKMAALADGLKSALHGGF